MNDLKEKDMVVIVVDIPEYCAKGKIGVFIKYIEGLEYPYNVCIDNNNSYRFTRDEIRKVGGLIV